MYYLRTGQSFDSAHFLKDYQGKCKNIHGHRWSVIVEIAGGRLEDSGQQRGMLVDFGDLKAALKEICDAFDHSLIYETGSLRKETVTALQSEDFRLVEVAFRPTAEHFAQYIYEKLEKNKYPVHRVEVYETPENCAVYENGDSYESC